MVLWIDDIRPAPKDGKDYIRCFSVWDAMDRIGAIENLRHLGHLDEEIEYLDIDHDAGDYADEGGDYINLLTWLEECGMNYPIKIHSMNSVGVENMRRIIQHNGWKEIY